MNYGTWNCNEQANRVCSITTHHSAYPDYNTPFVVHTDASQHGLGAVLYKKQVGTLRVIAYASRTLTPAERINYQLHAGKLEFLALKWSITEQFRDYVYYFPRFIVYTDNNPVAHVLSTAKLNATGLRWIGDCQTLTSSTDLEKLTSMRQPIPNPRRFCEIYGL